LIRCISFVDVLIKKVGKKIKAAEKWLKITALALIPANSPRTKFIFESKFGLKQRRTSSCFAVSRLDSVIINVIFIFFICIDESPSSIFLNPARSGAGAHFSKAGRTLQFL
jgi:hypothetical protein